MGFYTTAVLGLAPIGSLFASGLVVLLNRTLGTAGGSSGAGYTVAIGGAISLVGESCSWFGCPPSARRPAPSSSGPVSCRKSPPGWKAQKSPIEQEVDRWSSRFSVLPAR